MRVLTLAMMVTMAGAIGATPVLAQSTLYNSSTQGSTAARPVFLQGGQNSTGMQTSAAPYTESTTSPAAQAQTAAQITAQNEQTQASRVAQIKADYEVAKAQGDAVDAQRRKERLAAAGGAAGAGAATGQQAGGQVVDPYAGKTVVLTNQKKDDKPVRLFNVQ